MNPSVLWVDDQISGLMTFVEATQKLGFNIRTASSAAEGLEIAATQQFDLILVDLNMPEMDGVEMLRRLPLIQKKAVFVALSSFLYLKEYLDELKNLDFPVSLLDKHFPDIQSDEFKSQFADQLSRFLNDRPSLTVSDQFAKSEIRGNPFDLSLEEFLRLPLVEKDRLTDRAFEIARPTIEKAFSEGYIWVLLCGSKDVIRSSGRNASEILGEQEILSFAKAQQRAPFQFSRPLDVDDFWPGHCSRTNGLSNYPIIVFQLGTANELFSFHFDTGSPLSFLSYEFLLSKGSIRPTTLFTKGTRSRSSNGEYRWARMDFSGFLINESTGQTRIVHIKGQAVRDWETSPFVRFCHDDCQASSKQSGRRVCLYRSGLIGRNLLVDNSIRLVLDGELKRTILHSENL